MIILLVALADTYSIDTTPGATVSFVSRGSNRWPKDDLVSTATIAGHRDMSRSICPGDAAYELVQSVLPAAVTSASAASRAPAPTPATPTSAEAIPEPSAETTPEALRSPPPSVAAGPPNPDWASPAALIGGAIAAGASGLLVRMAVGRRGSDSS